MNCFYNLCCCFTKCLSCFFGSYSNCLRKTCYEVTSSHFHRRLFCTCVCTSYLNLNIFCCTITDQQIMLLSHISNNRLVKIITGNLNRCTYYGTSKRNNRNIRSTTTDIYDHITAWLRNIDTSSDCCGYRLLDNLYISCSCCICCIFYRLLLYLCYSTRNTNRNSWLSSK